MELDPKDLLYPRGRITPDLLPERKSQILDDVRSWIEEALAKDRVQVLDGDRQKEAVIAWVYYRAFDAASVAMAVNPTSASESDQGSASFATDQRDRIYRMAQEFYNEFLGLAPPVMDSIRTTGGQSVHHVFSW